MADDSGQRLLDVIGDPSALDEFLGALTADSVPDNLVDSLARSLAAEFDVDSPNETLFDSSSANLTDISQSTVPFDFGPTTPDSNHLGHAYDPNSGNDLIQNEYNHSSQYAEDTSGYCDTTGSATHPSAHQHLHVGNAGAESSSPTAFKSSPTTTADTIYQSSSEASQLVQPNPYGSSHHSEPSSLSNAPVHTEKGTGSISATPSPVVLSQNPPTQQRIHAEPTTLAVAQPQQQTNTTNGPTHVYVTSTDQAAQYASLGQLVQAQQNAAVLAGMNQQLALNAQPGASFIIDPTTGQPMMVAGGNTFGTTNLLVAGVQPTYTMLPAQTSLFSNTITMQPQIQAIKTTHGTAAGFIQATTTGVQSTGRAQTPPATKAKAPPHLLPKPNNSGGTTPTSTSSDHSEHNGNGSTNSIGNTGNNVVVTSSAGSITMTTESLSQILQQQSTVSNSGGMSLGQPSFAIGAGGQVVQVSGMQTLNSLGGSQIFMNQFGQQMIVPTAMSQGVQFIVRQQPQPQMLTIQAPAATAQQTTTNGKVVRFVQAAPQVPQVTQNSIQLQQIQTPQGTTWVAVRSAPVQSQPVVSIQSPSPAPPPPIVVATRTPTPPPPPPTPPQPPPVVQVTTDTISACIQSVIERLKSPSPPLTSTVQSSQYSSPISSVGTESTNATPDYNPPPKKKPKYSKKKKVTLDLEQLLKQSGIMDEDLQDDGSGFTFGDFFSSPGGTEAESGGSQSEEPIQQNGIHNNNNNTNQKDFHKPNGAIVQPFIPTVPTHSHILKPSTKSKQRKTVIKIEPPSSPVPITTSTVSVTPPKAPSKKSKKKSPSVTTIKIEVTGTDVPTPTKPPSKSKKKKKNSAEPLTPNGSNVTVITTPSTPTTIAKKSKPKKKKVEVKVEPEESCESSSSNPGITQGIQSQQQPSTPRRIVQTIQLTPQNQTLLRNIQAQIQKLLSLTTRNELEETALQKFISLQAEVIKTGTPVPNPPHLQTLNSSSNAAMTGSPPPMGQPSQPHKQNGNGDLGLTNGVNGVCSKSGSTTKPSNNYPPPLIPNKSCGGNTKLLITTTATTNSMGDLNSGGNDLQQKMILLTGQCQQPATPTSGGTMAAVSDTVPSNGDDEMTSNAVSILPTTTISTSIPGVQLTNGLSNGVYYNSFDTSEMTLIDEKKLEEQMMARLEQEEEARIQWRKDEFEKRLAMDHQFFTNPNYATRFNSLEDAADRLMHYHVGRDTAEITFEEFDEDFAETSSQLLNKFSGMVSKYRALLLKESMKDVECSERVMLERMFVAEEKVKLEHDRGMVQQGEILDLPPPPSNWIPRIRQMVDAEVKEMERDCLANQQVQSAIDSIMSFEPNGTNVPVNDDKEKIEYDAFGVPISSSNYNNLNSSSADIDEAVRSILL